MSAAKERLEKIFYAAVGAGDSWVETASELIGDSEKRSKRLDTLAKRGKKRLDSIEKNMEKRRERIRKQIETRLSQERFEEIIGQARDAIQPVAERLGVSTKPASRNSQSSQKKSKGENKAPEASTKAAS